MLRALPYSIILALVAFMGFFYMENYQNGFVHDVLIKIDVFGISSDADAERKRLAEINDLSDTDGKPLPYEEKQVLINKTVFLGATTHMVTLALGNPKKSVNRMWQEKNVMLTYYVYYLIGDKRPTVLVFKEDRLIEAYKGSAADYADQKE